MRGKFKSKTIDGKEVILNYNEPIAEIRQIPSQVVSIDKSKALLALRLQTEQLLKRVCDPITDEEIRHLKQSPGAASILLKIIARTDAKNIDDIRPKAISLLGYFTDANAIDVLKTMVLESKDLSDRARALIALSKTGSQSIFEITEQVVQKVEHPVLLEAAIIALENSKSFNAIPVLELILTKTKSLTLKRKILMALRYVEIKNNLKPAYTSEFVSTLTLNRFGKKINSAKRKTLPGKYSIIDNPSLEKLPLPLLLEHLEFDFKKMVTLKINSQVVVSLVPPAKVIDQITNGNQKLLQPHSWMLVLNNAGSIHNLEIFHADSKNGSEYDIYCIKSNGKCTAKGKVSIAKEGVLIEIAFPFTEDVNTPQTIIRGKFDPKFKWHFD